MDTLRSLLVEQTSPVEVLLFIAVTVAFCLAVAALVYVSVLVALWAVRLRKSISLRRLFLPTWGQFREFAGEYLLAATTALLLTATLIAKHDLVETIRMHEVHDLSGSEVARLFPLEDPPDELQVELARVGTVSVHALLKPVLAAGRAEEAKLFVQGLVGELEDETLLAELSRSRLLTTAIVLGALYLVWLGSRRVKELRADPDDVAAPTYGKTVASLLVLAVCIALVLATPRLLADTDAVVDSTLAAVRHRDAPPKDRPFETRAGELLDDQLTLFPNLRLLKTDEGEQPENLIELVADARRAARDVGDRVTRLAAREEETSRRHGSRLDGMDGELRTLADRLDGLSGSLERLQDELGRADERSRTGLEEERQVRRRELAAMGERVAALEDLDSQLAALQERLQGLGTRHESDFQDLDRQIVRIQTDLDSLDNLTDLERRLAALEREEPTTGTLVVFVHSSRFGQTLTLSGPTTRRFTGPAVLHDLPPGRYRVSGGSDSSDSVRVEVGGVAGVSMGYIPVIE